nr:lysophosphatidylcholine acyltransferase 2 [Anolis sagrei ordinatus]
MASPSPPPPPPLLPPRSLPLPRQQSLASPTVLNPFVQEARLDKPAKTRAILFGLILVPLRVIGMLLTLLMAWPFALLATFGAPEKGTMPLQGWKRKLSYSALTFLGHVLFIVMGFWVKVKGKVASPKEAPILAVAPHSSFFDGIVCVVAGLPSTVSRQENLMAPFLGRILNSLQPVVVSRVDPDSRKNTINEITRRATSGGQWPQVLVFPEGTCTNRSCLITFKQVILVANEHYKVKTSRFPFQFLPVHIPTEEEKHDPILFANRVRNKMSSALGVPVTDHTYEDCRLMISAGQLTLPMEAGLVEFTKISKKLNLKWDNIREQLSQFAAIANASKGGRIGIEEFANYLKLPVSEVLGELFALFDRNGDGSIDFREYVIGLSVLCNPANTEQTIQMAFQLFDIDEDGIISEDEFALIIRSSLGLPDLDVSNLFKEIDADKTNKLSYEEFKDFALKHPEYAKLFTTYIELQRSQLYTEAEFQPATTPKTPVSEKSSLPRNKVCPQTPEDDHSSASDKKED